MCLLWFSAAHATTCSFTSIEFLEVGRRAVVDADLVVRNPAGQAEVGQGSRVDRCALLDADSLVLGAGVSARRVRARAVALGEGATLEQQDRAGDTGGGNAPCTLEQPTCERGTVRTIQGQEVLLAGVYGRLRVRAGATLTLAPGNYSFCSVRVEPGARIEFDNPVRRLPVRVSVVGRLRLDEHASLVGASNAPLTVEAGGRRVRLRRRASLEATVVAPASILAVGRAARLRGGGCSRAMKAGARVRFECPDVGGLRFVDGSVAANVNLTHSDTGTCTSEVCQLVGGLSVADFDGDRDDDIFIVAGHAASPQLLRNKGDGTFEDVAAELGLDLAPANYSGPTFVDVEGDGDQDLLVGGASPRKPRFFRNDGDTFTEIIGAAGVIAPGVVSASFADTDRDGDLDLFVGDWRPGSGMLPGSDVYYRQGAPWQFLSASQEGGFGLGGRDVRNAFTPNFTDLDGDGWLDIVLAADFGRSRVFGNDGTGNFIDWTTSKISDENGMGAAVGDVDGDGDLDWFVSSIWDPDGDADRNWGVSGNRLYRNIGGGDFEDITDLSGLRRGFWGWGACLADFDLDGDLDLFHTNGIAFVMSDPDFNDDAEFHTDPALLALNEGDGRFYEAACQLGIEDNGEGRGVACFDFDKDGDIDILVSNRNGPARLWRNELNAVNFLEVRLAGRGANSVAAGAKVTVVAGGRTQVREIRIGSNYASSSPPLAHFGLGAATVAERVRVDWPTGGSSLLRDVAIGSRLLIVEPEPAKMGG